MNVSSRFLEDIPDELKSKAEPKFSAGAGLHPASHISRSSKKLGAGYKPAPAYSFTDGQRVRHNSFGEGVVLSTEDDIITIAFMKSGVKKLSTKFAELEKI